MIFCYRPSVFQRRMTAGNKMDFIQLKSLSGRARDQEMTEVKRVEGSPKKTDPQDQKILLST